jgi:hypothetical protein
MTIHQHTTQHLKAVSTYHLSRKNNKQKMCPWEEKEKKNGEEGWGG